MSPRTRLLVSAICVGAVILILLNMMDVSFRPGYSSAVIVIGIAVILYALVTRMENRLRQKKTS